MKKFKLNKPAVILFVKPDKRGNYLTKGWLRGFIQCGVRSLITRDNSVAWLIPNVDDARLKIIRQAIEVQIERLQDVYLYLDEHRNTEWRGASGGEVACGKGRLIAAKSKDIPDGAQTFKEQGGGLYYLEE